MSKINVRGALLSTMSALAATTALIGAAPAHAQQSADQASADAADAEGEENNEDTIVVVGSRIRRDNFNSPSPVQIITRDDAVRAGLTTTTEILQSNAATGGAAQINNAYGGYVVNGGGVNTFGLRGFGATSTLVLLNGRRLTPAGTRGAVGAADLNTIPSALVERIDILKDGASSIYGSDAVAGVVNIITNQDLEEFVFESQLNLPEQSGGEQTRLSLSGGHRFGNLSLIGSLEYYEREAQTYGDREWSSCPGDGLRDPSLEDRDPLTGELKCFTVNTGFHHSAGSTINTIGTATRAGFGGPGAAATGNFNRWRPNSAVGDGTPGGPPNRLDGFEGVNGGGLGFANRDTFRPDMLDQYFITPTRTENLFLSGVYDLGGAHELYGEVLYSHRESQTNGFAQLTIDYPNNALLPSELRTGPAQNVNSVFPNPPPDLPMPAAYQTQVRAFTGRGIVNSWQDVDYFRIVAGMRGDLARFDGWEYDANVYYGRNDALSTVENILTDRIFQSLVISPAPMGTPANLVRRGADGNPYVCTITLTNPAYGCIPAPVLNTQTVAGQYPGDWYNWIRENLEETNVFKETSASLVVSGPLFALPGGRAQGVFGVEYRTSSINDTPDFNNIHNNVYGFSSAQITRGEDSVREAFTELEFPFVSNAPFARTLTLNVSGRYTDYDSYGSDSTYKVGLNWEPIEYLVFRATQGTSFRAPALFEQFLGPTTGFLTSANDPCSEYGTLDPSDQVYINCDAEIGDPTFQQLNGITVFSGGGAATNLFAERSENSTIGFTWRPLRDVDRFGELSLAADRFSVNLRDSVTRIGGANILGLCYFSPNPATEPACNLVTRDAGNRLTVNNNYTNIANQLAEGWDIGARYEHSLAGGELRATLNLTNYTTQTFQLLPVIDPTDTNGTIGSPETLADLAVNYERGPWTFRYGVTWIDAMDDYGALEEDPATSPFIFATPDYYLHDLSVQYSTDAWQLTAGVRNMFDEAPPPVSSADPLINGLGSVPIYSGFDYTGRQFFVNLSTRF